MPTVVVTDCTFPDLEIEAAVLRPLGVDLRGGQCRSTATLIPLVADADVVITQFAPVSAPVIAAMTRARAIVRYGVGVDNVDLAAAKVRGIPVCNVPDYCIDEVADHALAFILAMTRQVLPNAASVRAGNWGLASPLDQMRTLRDQTVGIVGFGRIGREVAARLAPFKCRRLVFDPVVPAAAIAATGCEASTFDEILSTSDIVTLHCPSTPRTRKMIGAAAFGRMKPGAIFVNVARGDLVDSEALAYVLASGRLAGAALDVFDPEPIPADSPIRTAPNVIAAAHIASTSPRSVRTLRETAARIASAALAGDPLPNVVNGVAG
jgi:D-3-phosphoglycerate dehydrogenase